MNCSASSRSADESVQSPFGLPVTPPLPPWMPAGNGDSGSSSKFSVSSVVIVPSSRSLARSAGGGCRRQCRAERRCVAVVLATGATFTWLTVMVTVATLLKNPPSKTW